MELVELDIHAANPIPESIIRSHLAVNVQRDIECIKFHPVNDEWMAVCGGGPSLARQIDSLKKSGDRIFGVNGSANYLHKNGVRVWGCVLLDPLPWLSDCFEPLEDVTYFVASQCHPDVFAKLEGNKKYMWHAGVGAEERPILEEQYGKDWVLIGGGSTVGMRSINLGYMCGFRKFRIYGMDSSLQTGEFLHAYSQDADIRDVIIRDGDDAKEVMWTYWKGERFLTTPKMARQAQDFVQLMKMFTKGREEKKLDPIKMEVVGDGLIPEIFKDYAEEFK